MDLLFIFIKMFTFIFKWCLNIDRWIHPIPEQLFVFDDDKLYVRGFISGIKKRVRIDHFKIDGDYTIILNGDPLRFIKNLGTDGFVSGTTYFLTTNCIILREESIIEIIDLISDKKKIFKLLDRTPIDFLAMIKEMDE
jgi:hypothetical protein